ncbi:MAG: DUF3800 domain-containing protein [Pirellulaceae bacterium]|nr:DUF3800 domain-containing protein [Pirellulaceae bacterium]
MTDNNKVEPPSIATFYVDEAGDGILFGPMGRNRLDDPDAPKFFMLGMVRCTVDAEAEAALSALRASLLANPLYATIHTMRPSVQKTARSFHAKDDHAEVRAKVFEALLGLDFKFFAVIKDMRSVLRYVEGRNQMHANYRYHPNELYDLTVRMLFKNQLHKHDQYEITFARRGASDRTKALVTQLDLARQAFIAQHGRASNSSLGIHPAYPWQRPCLQIADYCLWALQRCYERHECRFLQAIWNKVSFIHDVDDPRKTYGSFLTRNSPPPDPEQIKNRWI